MKRNIDLTDNEIFSRANTSVDFDDFFLNPTPNRYPWNVEMDFDDDLKNEDLQRTFPLGNRERRKLIKDCIISESNDHCDCCGESLITIPWDRAFGLCRKCQYRMEKEPMNNSKDISWGKS